MLWNNLVDVLAMFSKYVGIIESSELEVLAISEALRFFSSSFHGKLVIKSDFMNAISWGCSPSKAS